MEQALAEFERLEDRRAVAVMLHRLSVGALMAEDLPRARRLVEESLAMCLTWPNPKLEADAVAKLAWIEHGEGNVERALELFEKSARLCEQTGFTWIQAASLLDIAELSYDLGRPEVAEARGREGLRLARELVDRATSINALGLLARFAAEDGDVERAGRLWGAIEAEVARGPVGLWQHEDERLTEAVLARADERFEAAAGRLSLCSTRPSVALGED